MAEMRIKTAGKRRNRDPKTKAINQYGYIKEGGKHPQAVIGNKFMAYKRTNPIKSAYVKQLLGYIDSP